MLEVEPFTVELSTPVSKTHGPLREREGFVVRIDHAGTTGVGEATPLPGWTETDSECESALSRAGELAEQLDWGIALTKTEPPAARHALALALSDAQARAGDRPLYRALGADRTVRAVPVSTTLGDADPAATADAAVAATEQGFDCLKVEAGRRSVETDIDRIRAVRDHVDVPLRVDANGAWEPAVAERALEAFADLGVAYVEQPLPAEDLSGHAALRGRRVDVALDESLAAYDVDQVLAADAADVVVLKPMVLGGPDLTRAAALRAREAGVEPVIATTVDAVVGRTGAVHVAASVPDVGPCELASGELLRSDLAPDPAPVADGEITVPQGGGLGLPTRP